LAKTISVHGIVIGRPLPYYL